MGTAYPIYPKNKRELLHFLIPSIEKLVITILNKIIHLSLEET